MSPRYHGHYCHCEECDDARAEYQREAESDLRAQDAEREASSEGASDGDE